MTSKSLARFAALAVALLALPASAATGFLPPGDALRDCEDLFGFYGTVDGTRFSPVLDGDLARVSIEGFLSDPYAAKRRAAQFAAWEITVETGDGIAVRRWHGSLRFDAGEAPSVQVAWDGRDDDGRLVPEGTWWVRFRARAVPEDTVSPAFRPPLFDSPTPPAALTRDDVAAVADLWEDSPFTDAIAIEVSSAWSDAEVRELRFGSAPRRSAGPVPSRVATPHEPSYPFSFWYSNPHAHTTRSDGGGNAAGGDCASSTGRVDGAYPDDAYAVASSVGDLDILIVAEHDHLIDNALNSGDTRVPSGTGATIPTQVYQQGLSDAAAATTASFVGIYGYEFGTITGCGHVNIYDAPKYMASNPDPQPMFAYTPEVSIPHCQYADAGDLYDLANQAANRSPATGLPHIVLNHPTDANMFESYKKTAFADSAVRGMAVISGSATSCATNFPTGGTGSTGTYKNRYIQVLDAGWTVAPEAHQDNHGDNYGNHSEVRTVYLAPTLTKANVLLAQFNRRAYATQDRDGQLIFRATPTASGAVHEMGESIGGLGGVAFHVSFWQPDNDTISTYKLLRGQVGGGCTAFSCLTTIASGPVGTPAGAAVLNVSDTQPTGLFFYVVEITQPGKLDAFIRNTVSAPIWVDYALSDTTCTPPGAPNLTAATGSCTGVALTWTAGTGTTASYNVYRGAACGSVTKIAGPIVGTSWTDTTGAPGTTYTYAVRGACDASGSGESPNSNCRSAATTAAPAPTGLTATGSCSAVDLSWSATAGATSYTVLRGSSCGGVAAIASGVTGTTWSDTTAVAGTTYSYAISAVNGCGTGGTSSCATGTRSLPAPSAPTGLAATGGCTGNSLSWNVSAGATSYTVLRGTTCGGIATLATGLLTPDYLDTSAAVGTTYSYAVIAANACGSSAATGCATATRPATASTPAPTNVTATAAPSSVTVAWDNVLASGSYSILRATGNCASGVFAPIGSVPWSAGARLSFVDSPLAAGTSVCYRVVATSSGCDSLPSACNAASCATPGTVPEVSGGGALEPFRLRALAGDVEFRFEWKGATYKYHLYEVADETTLDAGTWSAKFCDLAGNAAGLWATDSSTWITWTLADPAALSAGNLVVVAEQTGTEGPYGYKSTGDRRTADADRSTPANSGCSSAPVTILSQDWSNAGLITASDDWSGVTGIVGYRGDALVASDGIDPQTVTADGSTTPVDVNANQANPNTYTTGGVAEFAIADPVVALNGSATADAPHLVLTFSTTALTGISVSYNLRDLDGSTDNAVSPVALQYRVGTTGPYTNLAAGFVADASTGPSLATLVTPVAVTLPAGCENQATVQVRILSTNSVGNDEWIGIDDILVTGTP